MKLLLLFLITNTSLSQPLILDSKITKIAVNHEDTISVNYERILLIFHDLNIGVITQDDSLALVLINSDDKHYKDIIHESQDYVVNMSQATSGRIIIFISPIKPYRRKLSSLIIQSL